MPADAFAQVGSGRNIPTYVDAHVVVYESAGSGPHIGQSLEVHTFKLDRLSARDVSRPMGLCYPT